MKKIILLSLIILFSVLTAKAQLFRKHQSDTLQTSKTKKYYEFWDKDSTSLSAKGKFCQGAPCKTWRYYYKDGTRRKKVKYGERLKIKNYFQNGRLETKGYAILVLDAERIHFYWTGPWKYYDKKRKLYRIALYENGQEVEVIMGPEDPVYFE